jgi:dienelactone hydrolase
MGPLIALAMVRCRAACDADSAVPVGKARRLAAVLDERRVPHEVHVYPGAEHVFDSDRSPGSAGQDAWTRTVAFLHAH